MSLSVKLHTMIQILMMTPGADPNLRLSW
jgi:hypothetical protein